VSAQRYSPAAERSIAFCMSGWEARWRIVCRSGGTCERSRVFAEAITAMRASAFSAAHFETGEIHSSCWSDACLKKAADCPSIDIETTGLPPAFSTSS
jgi:hypothetical protein